MLTRRSFAFLCGAAPAALFASPTAEQEAQKAAEAWLALVDSGKYGESWDAAAAYFKKQVPRKRWIQMIGQVREPLGTAESRALSVARRTTSLPGAPDGDYVVMQYKTGFARKKAAVETITPMKDPDGVWRVSGYFIK